ncbi:TIGR03936 family radical SAM-associated protein [Vallitalea okinawensis]|uniref:TIGR03936 family radical SAM-associated protein n=1 Tax=Vallitalea okinawensis TaxID=2078660 RepID=UPI000CFE1A06|nr:TIGR03936 family radical SAM-associated protein [Vallitalea okinawensis]
MRKRIKFNKHGQLKYIGHLDLQRLLHRALRKAEIPVEYSKGFNPHPITSFAQPLSLGFISEAEYMDMTLTDNYDNQHLIDKMNTILPEGLRFIDAIDLADKAPKAMAIVEAARYTITLDQDIDKEEIQAFMNQEEILVEKMTKKKRLKTIDIKPGIYELIYKDSTTLEVFCSAGSSNVKPQLIVKALYDFIDLIFDEHLLKFKRHDLYLKREDQFIPLIDA